MSRLRELLPISKFVSFCARRNLKCSRLTREFSITYAQLQIVADKATACERSLENLSHVI